MLNYAQHDISHDAAVVRVIKNEELLQFLDYHNKETILMNNRIHHNNNNKHLPPSNIYFNTHYNSKNATSNNTNNNYNINNNNMLMNANQMNANQMNANNYRCRAVNERLRNLDLVQGHIQDHTHSSSSIGSTNSSNSNCRSSSSSSNSNSESNCNGISGGNNSSGSGNGMSHSCSFHSSSMSLIGHSGGDRDSISSRDCFGNSSSSNINDSHILFYDTTADSNNNKDSINNNSNNPRNFQTVKYSVNNSNVSTGNTVMTTSSLTSSVSGLALGSNANTNAFRNNYRTHRNNVLFHHSSGNSSSGSGSGSGSGNGSSAGSGSNDRIYNNNNNNPNRNCNLQRLQLQRQPREQCGQRQRPTQQRYNSNRGLIAGTWDLAPDNVEERIRISIIDILHRNIRRNKHKNSNNNNNGGINNMNGNNAVQSGVTIASNNTNNNNNNNNNNNTLSPSYIPPWWVINDLKLNKKICKDGLVKHYRAAWEVQTNWCHFYFGMEILPHSDQCKQLIKESLAKLSQNESQARKLVNNTYIKGVDEHGRRTKNGVVWDKADLQNASANGKCSIGAIFKCNCMSEFLVQSVNNELPPETAVCNLCNVYAKLQKFCCICCQKDIRDRHFIDRKFKRHMCRVTALYECVQCFDPNPNLHKRYQFTVGIAMLDPHSRQPPANLYHLCKYCKCRAQYVRFWRNEEKKLVSPLPHRSDLCNACHIWGDCRSMWLYEQHQRLSEALEMNGCHVAWQATKKGIVGYIHDGIRCLHKFSIVPVVNVEFVRL